MPKSKKPEVLLGFDFGMRHIGVAVGQVITKTANPLTILKAQDGIPDWKIIHELIEQWKINALVVGIPFNMDGSEQTITQLARKFAQKLQGRFHLPVFLVDERLTSKEAKYISQNTTKSDNSRLDSIAAKLILESWLRENT